MHTSTQTVENGNKEKVTPITVALVGAGNRTNVYSTYAEKNPEKLQVVAVVEPDEIRRERMAKRFQIADENCFASVDDFVKQPVIADAAINGTMDQIHVQTTIPLLAAGYHVLLEKPIGTSEQEVRELMDAAYKYDRKVMICHVLRFAPFYRKIKETEVNGEIGDILTVQTAEHVSYHHMAVSFVRGKWGNQEQSKSSMLMAKCCHDLDILAWLMSGVDPKRVSSFGSLMYFRPDQAPEGAGTCCLVDCNIEHECPFSAKKNYVDQNRWGQYVWRSIEHLGPNPTTEQKLESLRTDNPYGRCVWKCDNDVVDHQSVIVEFENGATATHNMVGGSARSSRTIHIVGTKGEIEGCMEDGSFTIRRPNPNTEQMFEEEKVDIAVSNDMHGGGDLRLVDDFVSLISGNQPSISTTTIEDSINGHLIGFAADQANEENVVVNVRE